MFPHRFELIWFQNIYSPKNQLAVLLTDLSTNRVNMWDLYQYWLVPKFFGKIVWKWIILEIISCLILAFGHEGFIARIDVVNRFRALVMVRSIIAVSSIITLQILSLSPVLACDPYLYSGDFEEMLNDGESWEIVLDSMKNSIGYAGQSCFYEFKKYSKKNKSKFPNLYMMMSK